MPDHKNFVGCHGKNAFSPRLTRVFPVTTIYSYAEPRVGRLLIFGRNAQIDSQSGTAKRLSKAADLEDI
jgi:hypothetical protein